MSIQWKFRYSLLATALLLSIALVGGSDAHAFVLFEEHWDAGDTNGAIASTTSTTVVRDDSVGNPAASIALRRILADPIFDIGVTSEEPGITGDYSAAPALKTSFDVLYDLGAFSETQLRFRFQDSTFEGWHLGVANVFPAGWQSYSVTFDPSWTDVEAAANGWIDETGGTVSWQQLMTDIYHPEIRLVLGDLNSALAHVDNVVLEAIPEPASFLLLASSVLAMCSRRRIF